MVPVLWTVDRANKGEYNVWPVTLHSEQLLYKRGTLCFSDLSRKEAAWSFQVKILRQYYKHLVELWVEIHVSGSKTIETGCEEGGLWKPPTFSGTSK